LTQDDFWGGLLSATFDMGMHDPAALREIAVFVGVLHKSAVGTGETETVFFTTSVIL